MRFRATPKTLRDSCLLSQRHCRRWFFRTLGHAPSIFLEPFAPSALPDFNATMAPLTPARLSLPDRSLCFMEQDFRPFRLQTPGCSADRFCTLPLSVDGFRIAPVWASPQEGRLARQPGRIEFTFVADWPFAFRCSPPRLTATQFRSTTGRRTSTRRGLAPLNPIPLANAPSCALRHLDSEAIEATHVRGHHRAGRNSV